MANKYKAVQNKPKQSKVETKKGLTEAKEPSKQEILFFRIGMIAISAIIVAFAAFIVINSLLNKDEEVPYDDYVKVVQTTLDEIVKDNGDNTYGDFTYFNNYEGYENISRLINKNDVIYFYFYHSSEVDEDVQAAIEAQTMVGLIPTETLLEENEEAAFAAFIFIDLDASMNAEIFADTVISHLGLDEDENQMLVTFDIYNPDGEPFSMVDDADDIIEIINSL